MATMLERTLVVRNLEMIDVDALVHSDLREAAIAGVISEAVCADDDPFDDSREEIETCRRWIAPHGTTMACYRVAVGSREDATYEAAESAEAVVITDQGVCSIGVAWGADAQWGDLHICPGSNDDPAFEPEVLAAINDYLHDDAAWEARGSV